MAKRLFYKGKIERGYTSLYGYNWLLSEFPYKFTVEMTLFREKLAKRIKWDMGGVEPMHHFKEMAKELWPENPKPGQVGFVWHPWADKMLERSCKESALAIAGSGGFGKCLAPDTLVLMADGSTKSAKDVVVGDKLTGDKMDVRLVTHTEVGESRMYWIIPDDMKFQAFKCNETHILTLKRGDEVRDIHLQELLENKHDGWHLFKANTLETSGFSIAYAGWGDWAGFSVDGNGRFLLGDFTVTHNSEFAAIWAIINFLADPPNTLVFVTSTTLSASKKRIWGKVVKYWNAISSTFPMGKLVESEGVIRYVVDGVAVVGDLAGITLVPAEKKKEKEAMGKLQGMHQERIIFIADEHSEISPAVTEAAFYNLKLSAQFFQFIGIANPASFTDAFGEFSKPKDGWETISADMDEWETERGVCLHFDHTRNPNVLAGQKLYGWMPTQEDIDLEIKSGRGNTAAFWRMYRGFWVPAGVDDQVFSEVEIVNAKAMDKAVWLDNKTVRISFLDPSFTNGGDRTMACFATFGKNMEGLKVLSFDEWLEFKEDVTDKKLSRSQQLAQWWRNACIARNVQPRNAGMDATGGGGPLSDMIAVVWSKDIFKLNFGGKASELPVSAFDPTPSCDRYVNSCTEIWFSTKEYMLTGQIKGIDRECMREMCLRKIDRHGEKNINLRLKVLPKSEMKAKHGMSPDYAEAAMGCVALARARLSFDTIDGVAAISDQPEPKTQWKNLFNKFASAYS